MKTSDEIGAKNTKDLSGFANAKFKEAETMDTICSSIIPDYNVERFEAIAMRVYLGKENIITIYALDKRRQEGTNFSIDKLPVKKFKVQMSINDLIEKFSNINFTIGNGNFDLNDIEVLNK